MFSIVFVCLSIWVPIPRTGRRQGPLPPSVWREGHVRKEDTPPGRTSQEGLSGRSLSSQGQVGDPLPPSTPSQDQIGDLTTLGGGGGMVGIASECQFEAVLNSYSFSCQRLNEVFRSEYL